MFYGNETVHKGEGWKSTTNQYSNKGPIIIVESCKMDNHDEELFRVLYDVVTRKLRIVIPGTGEELNADI